MTKDSSKEVAIFSRRILCWIGHHKPVLRDDLRFEIPYREEYIDRGLTIRYMGRRFYYGVTECQHCRIPIRVGGATWTTKMEPGLGSCWGIIEED